MRRRSKARLAQRQRETEIGIVAARHLQLFRGEARAAATGKAADELPLDRSMSPCGSLPLTERIPRESAA